MLINGIPRLYCLSLLLVSSLLCGIGFGELITRCEGIRSNFRNWKMKRASSSKSTIDELATKGLL